MKIVERAMLTRQKQTKKAKKLRRNDKPAKQKQLTPGQWFEKLVAVQARLRGPNGCPWDREQTHQSLRTYLIEEAYEVLEALESGNDAKFAEEMGDLLLQIVFHSQIEREEGSFRNRRGRHARSLFVGWRVPRLACNDGGISTDAQGFAHRF